MRIVEVTKEFKRGPQSFLGGHRYVMAEDIESQLRSVYGNHIGMSYPIESTYRQYKGEDLTGKKLMCWRTGGIGDMFFLSPVFRYLKSRYEGCFIRMASGCKEPLMNLPEIDELYDMPFDAELLNTVDYHLMFQGIIEGSSEKSKKTHAVDMFFSYFSIDSFQLPNDVKKPRLVFTDDEMSWKEKQLKAWGITETDFVIGIQLETSSPIRNYPKEKIKTIIDVFSSEPNTKVVMIGSEQQRALANFMKGSSTNVIDSIGLNVRQSIVMATRYDLVISPDSFMIQAAGALDKPLIGLYGPFPSEVRMKYFTNAIGLEPKVVCSPCFKHDFRACIKGYPSPCFSLVGSEDILQASNIFRFKKDNKHFNYMARFIRQPDLSEVQKYMLSADKGLCFFPGYFKHHNIIRVDTNQFVGADITDLSTEFKRDSFPFVLYMNNFSPKNVTVYQNCKNLVRPGGYLIVYKDEPIEQLFDDIKRDIGKSFIILYSFLDPQAKHFIVVGKKRY